MFHYILNRVHNLSDSSLVISSEQGRAIGGNEGLTEVRKHFRKLGRLQIEPRNALEGNVGAIVVFDDLRLDVSARSIRRCVNVGNESELRSRSVNIRRDATHYIAVLIKFSLNAQCN